MNHEVDIQRASGGSHASHERLPLSEVLATPELARRPSRPPDLEAGSRGFSRLAAVLASEPDKLLEELAHTILALCRADSAGISLLEPEGMACEGERMFRWPVVAGAFSAYAGDGMPRHASPCGTVLDRNEVLLFNYPERHFEYPEVVDPPMAEVLLAPFHVHGEAVGTVWAIAHTEERTFDSEDARLLTSLAQFASAGYQLTSALDAARQELSERELAEDALRRSETTLAEELAAMKRLQRLSTLLIQEDDIGGLNERILDAAITLMHGDMGSIQIYCPSRAALKLLAWRGFHPASAAFWEWVSSQSGSTCGQALHRLDRVVVPDVEACDFMAGTEDLAHYRRSGIRAVQSTPLLTRTGEPVGMISVHWSEPYEPSERELRLLDVLARQAADLLERTRREAELRDLTETLEERVRRRTEKLRELASKLTMAEQEERRRISRILHDDLQQLIYGVQLKLYFVRRCAEQSEQEALLENIDEVILRLKEAIDTARRLTVDLSPIILNEEGLTDTIRWLRSQIEELYNLQVEIEAEHAFHIPDDDMRVLLFQIVRELLSNVVKHARTDHARVELTEENGYLVIRVTDKGCGFDVEETEARQASVGGFGLFTARERLALFGGRIEIDSQPGNGTCVSVYTTIS